ncbi:S8 family serine peptidase [Actinoplanes sp. NPDC049548]|uniref:S8 family serine peptidase n=1 Tax=Actinoplanes sp. NPDC049548 TaxID=3155152 RepID=UPI0034374546
MRLRHLVPSVVAGLVVSGAFVAPADAATTTAADWTIANNAPMLADVARIIRADTAYSQKLTGKGVGIALIDTGVVPVPGLTSGNIANGPDLSLESQVPSLLHKDGYGHGTHLAGIIAGRDNTTGTGFRGIAPDAKLTVLKVGMSNGAVDVTQVMAAVDWVVKHRNDDPANPIKIINLSYGTDGSQSFLSDPLSYAVGNAVNNGINVVVAAGNTGSKITNPATAALPIVVGASDPQGTTDPADDKVSAFSSADGRLISVDVLAPGRSIVSLRDPGGYADVLYPAARVGDRYFKGSGTSQAAAVMSGALALYLQKYPTATPLQVRQVIWGGIPSLTGKQWKLDVSTLLGRAPSLYGPVSISNSNASGTLQAARGTSLVTFGDSTTLSGERDVFGALSVASWAKASAARTSWNGGAWMGHTYTGAGWGTATAGQANWSGATWAGKSWSGRVWSDVAWSGRQWSNAGWSGTTSDFTGRQWSGGSWSGAIWQ